jgi:hypothetical protein
MQFVAFQTALQEEFFNFLILTTAIGSFTATTDND